MSEENKECVWQYVSRSSDVDFYDDEGNDYYFDVALWKCKECGKFKIEEY